MGVVKGSFNTTNYDGRYLTFSWTATQDIASNTSTISWTLKGAGSGGSSWYNSGPFKVVIDGTTVYSSSTRIQLYEGTVVASGTKKLTHNSNGKKSFSASAEAAIWSGSINCKGSGSWDLTDIPRKATITTAPNFNDEENPTITYSNPAGSNVTTLQAGIFLDDSTSVVAYRNIPETGTSYTFKDITDAERTALRKATTGSNSRTVRFYIKTVIGGNNYYSYLSKTFSIINGTPTLSPTAADVNEITLALTGDANRIVKGYSTVQYSIGAAARKDATLTSQKVVCGSLSQTAGAGNIPEAESNVLEFSATDNRGNTTTQKLTKTLVNYLDPTCNIDVVAPSTAGEASITVSGNFFNGSFGTTTNTITVSYRYKINDGNYTAWYAATTIKSGNTYSGTINLTGLNYLNSYTFQARAVDKLNTIYSVENKVKTVPIFDWGEYDFNFNVPVSIQGSVIDDYIIEHGTEAMGTNGTWYWSKWKSGKAECYGIRNYGNMAVSNEWGVLFVSERFQQDLPSGLFVSAPSTHVSLLDSDGGAGWVITLGSTGGTSTTQTAPFEICRPSTYTIKQARISFQCQGRWK